VLILLVFRHTDVDLLIGDPIRFKTKFGWEPKYDLAEMVAADVVPLKRINIERPLV
jgi:GDPmannose 4,6-dehydratase